MLFELLAMDGTFLFQNKQIRRVRVHTLSSVHVGNFSCFATVVAVNTHANIYIEYNTSPMPMSTPNTYAVFCCIVCPSYCSMFIYFIILDLITHQKIDMQHAHNIILSQLHRAKQRRSQDNTSSTNTSNNATDIIRRPITCVQGFSEPITEIEYRIK